MCGARACPLRGEGGGWPPPRKGEEPQEARPAAWPSEGRTAGEGAAGARLPSPSRPRLSHDPAVLLGAGDSAL